MRVMISQPIEGTVEEQARAKAKVIAELEAEGHEVWGKLPQRLSTPNGVNEELWQLGRRLQDMAAADAVYFMDGWEKDRRCRLEYETCKLYGKISMNNIEFDTMGLLDFVCRYYPELLDSDHARCQICGAKGATGYGMKVRVNEGPLAGWSFNERNIFLCESHKDLAFERTVNYIEPHIMADVFKAFAQPWSKMNAKHRLIIYNMAKNLVDAYETRWGQLSQLP